MQAGMMPLGGDWQEKVRHGSLDFPIQYYVDELDTFPSRSVPLHWHPELEFFVVLGGDVEVQVGNTLLTLESGFGVFLNANVLHGFRQIHEQERGVCPNIVFSDELIASAGSRANQSYIRPITRNEDIPYVILGPDIPWQSAALDRLDRVFSLLQKYGPVGAYGRHPMLPFAHAETVSVCYELQVQQELNCIWQLLYAHLQEIPLVPAIRREHRLQIRMQQMLKLIQDCFAEPLTLGTIAAAANVSKSEAARCFRSYMRLSPMEYLLRFRLEKACQMLQNSTKTIQEISGECGFQTAGYFCRVFRTRMGVTAGQYRAAHTNT